MRTVSLLGGPFDYEEIRLPDDQKDLDVSSYLTKEALEGAFLLSGVGKYLYSQSLSQDGYTVFVWTRFEPVSTRRIGIVYSVWKIIVSLLIRHH